MSDELNLVSVRVPQYLKPEHNAAYARNGRAYFWQYEPEEAPAERPSGWVSRFEVPTARYMTRHRQEALAWLDELEALIPALDDVDVRRLAYECQFREDALDGLDVMSSLTRTGWRYGAVYLARKSARDMTRPAKTTRRR